MSDGAVFRFRAIFPGKKWLSVAFSCCESALLSTCRRISLRPGPRRSAREPFRDSNSSPRNEKSHRVFLRPPCRTFLAVMCLSVPLSTIQTFPLFLSFGIFFFVSPSVAFWVLGPGLRRDGHCPGRSVPSLVFLAVPGSRESRDALPRSPMKCSPQLQPSAFQRGEQTGRRCLCARRALAPHRVWHEASRSPKAPPKPPEREKLPRTWIALNKAQCFQLYYPPLGTFGEDGLSLGAP